MKSILGYGGVKIIGEGGDASFYGQSVDNSTAELKITYKPEFIKATNINRKIVSKFLGFRISINIDLINICQNDYIEFRYLWDLLSTENCGDDNISLQLNTTDGTDGITIDGVILSSSVSIDQLHRLEIGQSVKLKFDKKELVHDVSNYVNNLTSNNLMFNSNNAMFNSDNAVVN